MESLQYKLGITKNILSSRAGMVTLSEVIQRLQLPKIAKQHLPAPGSNRGYGADEMFVTMMFLLHNDGKCLDDIRELHNEKHLIEIFGLKKIPSVRTLGNYLRRLGQKAEAMHGLVEINRHMLAIGLDGRREVTLDIDATVIASDKADAKWTYKNHKGYTPMVGHLAETEQIVAVDFRDGKCPPNKENYEFILQCEASLPKGVSVTKVRIDAAGYQANIVNYLMETGKRFAIRAKMDATLKESISSIKADQWQPLVYADGTQSQNEEVARTLHVMEDTEAFTLVVQRKRIDKGDNTTLDTLIEGEDNSATRGEYIYRAIASNFDEKTNHEIVHWYNLRGETSENKIKQVRSDFAGARLPCGEFDANAIWFQLNALAYNLLCQLRWMLPAKWFTARAPRIRFHIYGVGAKIVRHARQLTIKVSQAQWQFIDEALRSIRSYPLLI